MLGASSEDIRVETTLRLEGETRLLRRAEVAPTRVELDG